MKSLRADDCWRKVYKRSYATRLLKCQFENVLGIGSGEVRFEGGISAICGANGVGKSTILHLIATALDGASDALDWQLLRRFENAAVILHVEQNGQLLSQRRELKDVGSSALFAGMSSVLVNPAAESADVMRQLRTIKNLDELLEAYDPAILSDDDLSTLSYLVGRDYERIEVFEVGEDDRELSFPYVRVQVAGQSYGAEDMGLGELALHLFARKLKTTDASKIVLLEEPESHISPRSQSSLMNLLAREVSARGLWTILTSHSPAIVSSIPIQHTRLVTRLAGAAQVHHDASAALLRQITGISAPISGVIFVEDSTAREFTRLLLQSFRPTLLDDCEIVDVGQGSMDIAVNEFPIVGPWLGLVAVYDGDMRDKRPQRRWPIAFLPGLSGPEKLLRNSGPAVVAALAREARRTPEHIVAELSELEGKDDHDWYVELASRCGLSMLIVLRVLFDVWTEDGTNRETAAECASQIDAAMVVARRRPLSI